MNQDEWLRRYADVYYVTQGEGNYLVWRVGTGYNVEILLFRTNPPRQGTGRRLLKKMLALLKDDPPYATVFGFTRVSNKEARAFYQAMGFTLSVVEGVYGDGEAVVFSARYDQLYERHLKEPYSGADPTQ